jgi:hypothetical protein
VRLLLDATVSTEGVGRRLAAAGHDVGALDQEPTLDGLDDEEVLELAVKDGSVLVTLNAGDYPRILREWLAAGRSHAGVILLHGIEPADFDEVVKAVGAQLDDRPGQPDWVDRAVVVSQGAVGVSIGGR